ncbi:MAG: hypothetical protein HBSAPP02_03780 [Phycisphaerae bacterium]|nr:MAG: PEP-CTERM sorting domain-containing protein [Planctomycetia bacterium]RIK66483.1 MAG: hypothetical protein DCC66_13025 [Planctomycetota bacterium]GJQ25346.1 MAG: hypothetical protein HBSAPP02_03780 [Phycisphaerae bacterium]
MSWNLRTTRAGMGFVLGLVGCVISTSPAFGQNRYFPPNTPYVLPNGVTVQSYGNNFTQFDREVTDNVKNLNAGTIRFDYNTWNAAGNPSPGGGGALTGGFFMADGITVKPGFALHWVQIVGRDTTTNGANDWGFNPQNQNGPFPDADATTPVYPYESLLPGVNPNPAPTLGFTDFPARPYAWGHQDWFAELALTCIANNPGPDGFRESRVIGSFFWGFEVIVQPGGNNLIGRIEPSLWGTAGATNDFITTMNEYYDGMSPDGQVTPRHRFENNSNCFVPEPAAGMLLLVAAGLALRRRSRCA